MKSYAHWAHPLKRGCWAHMYFPLWSFIYMTLFIGQENWVAHVIQVNSTAGLELKCLRPSPAWHSMTLWASKKWQLWPSHPCLVPTFALCSRLCCTHWACERLSQGRILISCGHMGILKGLPASDVDYFSAFPWVLKGYWSQGAKRADHLQT